MDKTLLRGIPRPFLFGDERGEGRENHVAKDWDGAFLRLRFFLSQLVAIGVAHWKGGGSFSLYLHIICGVYLSLDGGRMDEPTTEEQPDG